ncbi:Protein N-lysine methyltransferase FAM173B [Amphibalanus amphitrite]|uniref:Protein N-lysine methyltransferase FAM173B n=1 Tax=Amphibalanus amphitrite TaxID=1232801 RepID=A0A6A4X9D0_AMPAM|nr:ATP synthase subunit C lysine N-methyltransferase-like [Amphibalanus amphitrite]KAF0314128.1 Protein N-lysine methyltransferase FAM173B [Amphibalanus amphitrite]KAF0314129.1 Protein N-lysine methyltransferase FAM173B [Amphibalanus amphitrite]
MDELQAATAPSAPTEERPRSRVALVLASVTGVAAVGLTAVSWPFVAPAFRKVCLPYVPATTEQVTNVLRALKGRSGPLVDLGSGDGRIVIAAAAVGFRSVGVELNPWLVLFSRLWARREGLSPMASFRRADLFSQDLTQYQNVVIFGVKQMMPRLEIKLAQQLPVTGCVIACRFPLPTWRPSYVIGEGADAVWVYFRPGMEDEELPPSPPPPGRER